MSVLERCPSYKESNKRTKERQGPTPGVRLIEVCVKTESTALLKTHIRKLCRLPPHSFYQTKSSLTPRNLHRYELSWMSDFSKKTAGNCSH